MSAWITLTSDDLKEGMTSAERAKFTAIDTGEIAAVIASLVQDIRGAIANWPTNRLSADETLIPPSFRRNAVMLARWSVLLLVPGYNPGDARQLEYTNAMKFLDGVRAGRNRPEPPDDAVTNLVPNEAPASIEWTAPPHRAGRDRMNGL